MQRDTGRDGQSEEANRDGQKGAERDVQGGEAPPSEQMQRDTGRDGQSEEANRDGQKGAEHDVQGGEAPPSEQMQRDTGRDRQSDVVSEVQGGEAPPRDVQRDNKPIVVQPEVYRISNGEIYQNEILNDVIDLSGQLLYDSRTGMAYNMDNIDISQFTQLYFVDQPSDFTQFTQIKPHDCVPVVKSEDDDEVTIRIEQSAFVQHPPDGEKSGVDETGDRQTEQQTTSERDGHKEEEAALVRQSPDGEKSGLNETGDRHSEEQTTSEHDGHKEEEPALLPQPPDGEKSGLNETGDRHSEEQTTSERDGHKEEEAALVRQSPDGEKSGLDETGDRHSEEQTTSERDKEEEAALLPDGHKEEEVRFQTK